MSNVISFSDKLSAWNRLKPVYIQKWVWEKAVRHNPERYSVIFPVYQGQKVILT